MPDRITCTACAGYGKETSPAGKMHECRACDGYGYTRKAKRITRTRAKGWRKPAGAVIVTRGTIWGNPWGIGTPGTVDLINTRYRLESAISHADAVLLYESWLSGTVIPERAMPPPSRFTALGKRMVCDHLAGRRKLILANLDQLRGHDLCCWCKPGEPCHADVLLRLAAGGEA